MPRRAALPPLCLLTVCLALPPAAHGQDRDPQIELNVIALPTTRSIERHHGYFRLTHRFSRDLRLGDFSDLASDLFALDNGAILGLEYRFALEPNIHMGLHRSTLHKATQLFAKWDAIRQGARSPLGVSGYASFEALDNLQDGHQPGAALVLSRTFGQALALYASPTYVYGTFDAERIAARMSGTDHAHDHEDDQVAVEHLSHKATFYVGLAARARVRPTVFVVGEFTPRLRGHDPGDAMWGVGIEKWTRGHTLALTLTNSYATTPGQIARGGVPGAVYFGFNITRKF